MTAVFYPPRMDPAPLVDRHASGDHVATAITWAGWTAVAATTLTGIAVIALTLLATITSSSSTTGIASTIGFVGVLWGLAIIILGAVPGLLLVAVGRALGYLRAAAALTALQVIGSPEMG